MIENLQEAMNYFNIDLFWIGIIIIGSIVCLFLKANQPKPKSKPTTVDVLGDIRHEIGSLSNEVRGIKDKMK